MFEIISVHTLNSARTVLELDAALLRRSMQINYDAADPIPGVEHIKTIAQVLRKASEVPGPERARFLKSHVSADDVREIELARRGLLGPVVHTDPRELAIREKAGAILSDLLAALRPILGE